MAQLDSLDRKVGSFSLNAGIRKQEISHIVQGLMIALASNYTLSLKTQGCHWNVVGPHFYALHKLFEEQYDDLAVASDDLAERIRTLGSMVPARHADFVKLTRLQEASYDQPIRALLQELVSDHESMAAFYKELFILAEHAHDQATADLLAQRMAVHEKTVWMLRATLG
ncbi:MAG: DNA starvation/stationary phase protection protein [Pseudomonadota bacterium]